MHRVAHWKYPLQVTLAMAVAIALFTIASAAIDTAIASADPKPGLWQEGATDADGVHVRKIRDTTSRDFNICYVATMINSTSSPAIACVPERKP